MSDCENHRKLVALFASEVARNCRRRGPRVPAEATREDLIGWLEWNDPNGDYDDPKPRKCPDCLGDGRSFISDIPPDLPCEECGGKGTIVDLDADPPLDIEQLWEMIEEQLLDD